MVAIDGAEDTALNGPVGLAMSVTNSAPDESQFSVDKVHESFVLRALDSYGTPTPSGTFSARVRGRSSGLGPQQVG